MFVNILLISGSILSVIGIIFSFNSTTVAPTQPTQQAQSNNITLGSVSDLIKRLKPFVKNPEGLPYSNGISIRFSANDVKIELETKNGNKYIGEATTLEQAVSRITEPSNEIKSVLEGWKE